MARTSEKTPLVKKEAEKLPFPLGLVSPGVRPYLELIRFHKPTGTILMFWPFAWGLTMAAYHTELPLNRYWVELAKSLFAAFIVRGSACTINDIFDRKFDAGVERTKGRPLASGRVSVFAAVVYLILQYIAGLVVYVSYNEIALYAAVLQLLPLFLVYPLMKRITYWPQAWLGICMNFGLVVAWAAVTGSLDAQLLGVLMVGTWGWTMHYDTIYACQDRRDDVKVGVKSTAVMLGDYVRPFCFVLSMMFVGTLYYAGVLNHQTPYYFYISVGGTLLHILWQYATVDLDSPDSCGLNFIRNGHMGWITWAGLMVDYLVKIDQLPFQLPF
ncbi:prenyltransferase [Heterobasidion irregulare TC 32-1]|uniref:4-hydroxybenzoate polyprenyltransferase, mitochondrial n=1 Tax=Heterobasidion irregulare (strain TC 32-1) TaxID=747525 RepID=W4K2F5_HETIT|nr:prenyltransferase [Heterobasidion irregulare TC 32-1]ETW79987.1 prenyltransferase [Heterobasidion irregulare TC 32-1]